MLGLHGVVALFASYMLWRSLPAALGALRRRGLGQDGRPAPGGRLVPILNVLIAFLILALAVKGLAGVLIRR
jgi:hypothetical protein